MMHHCDRLVEYDSEHIISHHYAIIKSLFGMKMYTLREPLWHNSHAMTRFPTTCPALKATTSGCCTVRVESNAHSNMPEPYRQVCQNFIYNVLPYQASPRFNLTRSNRTVHVTDFSSRHHRVQALNGQHQLQKQALIT